MKTQQVCKDFLRLQKGVELDAMMASQLMSELWGIKVDWHEMAYALDYLERVGEATAWWCREGHRVFEVK